MAILHIDTVIALYRFTARRRSLLRPAGRGRFTSRDAVLSEHPYLYCEHEPVN